MKREWRFCKDCGLQIYGYAHDKAPRCDTCRKMKWSKRN